MIYEIGKGTGLYCSEGAGARVYYIARPEPMLVDTGAPGRGEALLRDLASISVQPIQIRKIILTHHHLGQYGCAVDLKTTLRRIGAGALGRRAVPRGKTPTPRAATRVGTSLSECRGRVAQGA